MGAMILVNLGLDIYLQIMNKKWCEYFEKTGGKEEAKPAVNYNAQQQQ